MRKMIKNLFNPGNYPQNINTALLLVRIIIGILMLTHGSGKFTQLFAEGPITFADPLGVGPTMSLALTVFAEIFCSLLLMFGLATRFAAAALLFTMLIAAFVVHLHHGLQKQELALLYGTAYLAIAMSGAGKFSVDHQIYSRNRSA